MGREEEDRGLAVCVSCACSCVDCCVLTPRPGGVSSCLLAWCTAVMGFYIPWGCRADKSRVAGCCRLVWSSYKSAKSNRGPGGADGSHDSSCALAPLLPARTGPKCTCPCNQFMFIFFSSRSSLQISWLRGLG